MSMIDKDLKDYLDVKFDALEDKIDGTKDDIKRHSDEIRQLYDMDRDGKERLRTVESSITAHIETHKESKDDKHFNIGQWVVIGICILTILSDKISF